MIGLQRLAIPSCPPAKCPPAKRPPFSLDLPAVIVVFIDILPNWGWFSIIKQICHASVGILMECLPSRGWFSLGLRPRENHPPSGRHSIRIPTLAWHICIMTRPKSFSELTSLLGLKHLLPKLLGGSASVSLGR